VTDAVLLDTHIALWLDSGDERLRPPTRDQIDSCWRNGGTIFFSAVTVGKSRCSSTPTGSISTFPLRLGRSVPRSTGHQGSAVSHRPAPAATNFIILDTATPRIAF
jgi:hypothetical protein